MVIGLLIHLQIIPLDATTSETWFYFPMIGLLGMIGVVLAIFIPRINPTLLIIIGCLLIGSLAFRTALRGHDYRDAYTIQTIDIAVSKESYSAYNNLSIDYMAQGKIKEAKDYAARSVSIFPTYAGYDNLATASTELGDYVGAMQAYKELLVYNKK